MADTELEIPPFDPPPTQGGDTLGGCLLPLVIAAGVMWVAVFLQGEMSKGDRTAGSDRAVRQPERRQNLLTLQEANEAASFFEASLAAARNIKIAVSAFQVDATDGHLNAFVRPELVESPPNVQSPILDSIVAAWRGSSMVMEKGYSRKVSFIAKDWSRTFD